MIRVQMLPHPKKRDTAPNGIARVVEAYYKYLPQFDVQLVDAKSTSYDLVAAHAGTVGGECDVSHCHGAYWTADYAASDWEFAANAKVIESLVAAKRITVPSSWVAEPLQRDMHVNPTVIPHGIEWDAWQNPNARNVGYALYNKNRQGDVCDAGPTTELARRTPGQSFVSTFATEHLVNLNVVGVLPHAKMRALVQNAGVYIATTKETFGIGILEAMASGVPVLGYAHGGITDIVRHGETGFLAPPGDIDALEAGLAYCLTHRKLLSANAREAARAWTWETAVAMVAKVYAEALVPDPPTVAIVIPCYNYAELLSDAVRSAVRQTYPDLTDIVIVDDGSQDRTADITAIWMREDPRVRYIRQENQGVAIARNNGIASTNTKYVCCLDADDALEPDYLAALIPALEEDRTLGIAYSGLLLVKDGKEMRGGWPNQSDYDLQVRGGKPSTDLLCDAPRRVVASRRL